MVANANLSSLCFAIKRPTALWLVNLTSQWVLTNNFGRWKKECGTFAKIVICIIRQVNHSKSCKCLRPLTIASCTITLQQLGFIQCQSQTTSKSKFKTCSPFGGCWLIKCIPASLFSSLWGGKATGATAVLRMWTFTGTSFTLLWDWIAKD